MPGGRVVKIQLCLSALVIAFPKVEDLQIPGISLHRLHCTGQGIGLHYCNLHCIVYKVTEYPAVPGRQSTALLDYVLYCRLHMYIALHYKSHMDQ